MPKTKKGPFSKAEYFYIEQHCDKLSVNEIAEDLNRSQTLIEKKVKEAKDKNPVTIEDQFVKQSGATIMTENASSMADAVRQKGPTLPTSCVTKIK
jgi:predicted transcriptional regulator